MWSQPRLDEAAILRPYLDLQQPLERPRDLPFLIALRAGRQRAGFA
jgi:hypothetical protein